MCLTSKFRHFRQTLRTLFDDYADHSTIQGLSYMNEKNRSWFEKFWWIFVFGISVLGSGKMIYDAWHIHPILISFTEQPASLEQIPFPAVTLCPLTFARLPNIREIVNHYYDNGAKTILDTFSEKEKLQLYVKNEFCGSGLVFERLDNYTNCNECLRVMNEIKIPFEEMFVECKFRNQVISCNESFTEVVVGTHAGRALCYTFNGLNIFRNDGQKRDITDEWSLDEGYQSTAYMDAYPRRALRSGPKYGLSVLMRNKYAYNDNMCARFSGTKLEYRMAYESPQFVTNFFNARMKFATNYILKPNMIKTSAELRGYPVSVRKCYFSDEHRLQHFNRYTQTNCEIECVADFVLEKCGCSLLIYDDRGIEICGPQKIYCIKAARAILYDRNLEQCDCLPTCTSISFDTEVFIAELNMSNAFRGHKFDNNEYEYSQIRIYFKENFILTSQRLVRYGSTDFLANCGGLLGLFLGVSVISLFEIVYFCTICLYKNLQIGERLDQRPADAVEESEVTNVKKTRGYLKILKELLADYFSKTTIQGFNFITDTELSLAERIWWAVVLALSTFCCASMILDVFRQYEQSPVIISYADKETSISEIPFPAVTICPAVVYNRMKLMHEYFILRNASLYDFLPKDIEVIKAAVQACDPDTYSHIDPENRTTCDGCSERLKWLLGGVAGLFNLCHHLGAGQTPCEEIFDVALSETGVCYTYNGLAVYRNQNMTSNTNDDKFKEWTLDGGYNNRTELLNVYPRKGSKHSLYLQMGLFKETKSNLCPGEIEGFKVFLHLPNEAPQVSKHFYLAAYQRYTQMLVYPSMTVTASELRDMSVEKRQCYFSDERRLDFFRSYTQNNCEIECVVNVILKKCNCLMFYMPNIPGVKFCGIGDIKCYQSAIQQNSDRNMYQGRTSECNCLPTCTSITYSADVNYAPFTDDQLIKDFDPQIVANFYIVHMEIIFRENQFVALERSQLYGMTEFMANIAGIVGLFLGFSIFSVFEMFYFCTIRLVCDIKLKMRHRN